MSNPKTLADTRSEKVGGEALHAGKPQWRKSKLHAKKLSFWVPRLMILCFALSVLLPALKFVPSLDAGGYTLWLARLTWVIAVPAVFGAILLVIAILKKK